MIATQIMGFLITVVGCTLMFTILFWGMFWAWVWTKRIYLLMILIPMMVNMFLEGWIDDRVYDSHTIKRRYLAGPLDLINFYLMILSGFGKAVKRFLFCFVGLIIC